MCDVRSEAASRVVRPLQIQVVRPSQHEGHEDRVRGVAIPADGKTAASCSDDRTVRVWSTATGEQTQRFNTRTFSRTLYFSADGTALNTDIEPFGLNPPCGYIHVLPTLRHFSVDLKSPWVRYNGSELLRLPQELVSSNVLVGAWFFLCYWPSLRGGVILLIKTARYDGVSLASFSISNSSLLS